MMTKEIKTIFEKVAPIPEEYQQSADVFYISRAGDRHEREVRIEDNDSKTKEHLKYLNMLKNSLKGRAVTANLKTRLTNKMPENYHSFSKSLSNYLYVNISDGNSLDGELCFGVELSSTISTLNIEFSLIETTFSIGGEGQLIIETEKDGIMLPKGSIIITGELVEKAKDTGKLETNRKLCKYVKPEKPDADGNAQIVVESKRDGEFQESIIKLSNIFAVPISIISREETEEIFNMFEVDRRCYANEAA